MSLGTGKACKLEKEQTRTKGWRLGGDRVKINAGITWAWRSDGHWREARTAVNGVHGVGALQLLSRPGYCPQTPHAAVKVWKLSLNRGYVRRRRIST